MCHRTGPPEKLRGAVRSTPDQLPQQRPLLLLALRRSGRSLLQPLRQREDGLGPPLQPVCRSCGYGTDGCMGNRGGRYDRFCDDNGHSGRRQDTHANLQPEHGHHCRRSANRHFSLLHVVVRIQNLRGRNQPGTLVRARKEERRGGPLRQDDRRVWRLDYVNSVRGRTAEAHPLSDKGHQHDRRQGGARHLGRRSGQLVQLHHHTQPWLWHTEHLAER